MMLASSWIQLNSGSWEKKLDPAEVNILIIYKAVLSFFSAWFFKSQTPFNAQTSEAVITFKQESHVAQMNSHYDHSGQ